MYLLVVHYLIQTHLMKPIKEYVDITDDLSDAIQIIYKLGIVLEKVDLRL